MASGRLFLPGWMPARDSNGDPIPNVSVSFYNNGTDVLASVYADSPLTIPLPNPVAANSSGRFPQIYASDAITYSASVDAPYGPAGQPFTFDGLQASQAADIAAANLAQGSAEDAEAAAAAAAADLAEINDIIINAPDAPSVANKVNLNADNLTSDAQKVAFKAGADIISFKTGPTAIFQSRFSSDWLWLNDPTVPNSRNGSYQGGAWAGTYDVGLLVSKSFKPEDFGGAAGPLPGLLVTTFSAGSGPDACTVGTMAIATANYALDTAFGGNIIAAAEFGVSNTKLVGLEIDVQHSGHLGPGNAIPGAGTAGLYINTFNAANSGDGIQINAHDGYWSNGIKLAGINPTIGAGLSLTGNEQTIGSLVNTTVGSYGQAGVLLGTGLGPGIRLQGPTGVDADSSRIFNTGGFLVFRQASNSTVFQSNDGTTTYCEIQNGGSFNISAPNAVLKTQGTQVVGARGAAVVNAVNAAAAPTQAEFNALVTQFNALLARVRTHGLIAP